MRALDLLARIERQELDDRRRRLRAGREVLDRLTADGAAASTAYADELALAFTMPTGPSLAASFSLRHGDDRDRRRASRARVVAEVALHERAVGDGAARVMTLDRAASMLADRERARLARERQRRLDDDAVVRHAAAVVAGRSVGPDRDGKPLDGHGT